MEATIDDGFEPKNGQSVWVMWSDTNSGFKAHISAKRPEVPDSIKNDEDSEYDEYYDHWIGDDSDYWRRRATWISKAFVINEVTEFSIEDPTKSS